MIRLIFIGIPFLLVRNLHAFLASNEHNLSIKRSLQPSSAINTPLSKPRTKSTWLCLFFKGPNDGRSNVIAPLFPDTGALQLPLQIESATTGSAGTLVLEEASTRHVQAIVDINLREYGSGPAIFPLDNPRLWLSFYERRVLAFLIDFSTRTKLLYRGRDHLTLVITDSSRVVGMVELSRQPPIKNRNPPPFPLPWKTVIYGNTQGWITNLLVVPEYRGRGLGKVLVKAVECIALNNWRCQSIHLHCDANDFVRLFYEKIGYGEAVLVLLEGDELVFFSKQLHHKCAT